MTETVPRARRAGPRMSGARKPAEQRSEVAGSDLATRAEESERKLARRVALFAPVATLGAAAIVGALTSIGPAILVLAGGSLFATIAFFWASLRTLGGDAPLAEGFDQMTRRKVEASDGTVARKRTALRALKDLEFEHSIGKIDDDDYVEISSRYREQAKAILREIEGDVLPQRERAEQMARAYLTKRGSSTEPPVGRVPPKTESAKKGSARRMECGGCRASNEPDAVFCKGCGARLAPKVCPRCAAVSEGDSSFCKKCGGPLGTPTPEKTDASG